jgi:hypothetical protein
MIGDTNDEAVHQAGGQHRGDHTGAALHHERADAAGAQVGQHGREVDATRAGRDRADAHR